MDAFLTSFAEQTAMWSDAVVSWTHPRLAAVPRGTVVHDDWPLMRLDVALAALAAYGLLILLGLIKRALEQPATRLQPSTPGGKSPRSVQTYSESAAAVWATLRTLPSDPLKAVQIAYNISQVALSAYMAVRCGYIGLVVRKYGFFCNPFEAAETDISALVWLFYASKLYDFMDTVFIVVRSKWAQFSFLHLYHHARCVVSKFRREPLSPSLRQCCGRMCPPAHSRLIPLSPLRFSRLQHLCNLLVGYAHCVHWRRLDARHDQRDHPHYHVLLLPADVLWRAADVG